MKAVTDVERNKREYEQIIINTDDGDEYVFCWFLWTDYPIFAHRGTYDEDGNKSRTYTNRLPERVEETIIDMYGGYHATPFSD